MVGDAAEPRLHALSTAYLDCDVRMSSSCLNAFSDNGRFVLVQSYQISRPDPIVVDLDYPNTAPLVWPTSRSSTSDSIGGIYFSPDGQWLFGLQDTGRVTAVHLDSSRSIEFDIVDPIAARQLFVSVAVG